MNKSSGNQNLYGGGGGFNGNMVVSSILSALQYKYTRQSMDNMRAEATLNRSNAELNKSRGLVNESQADVLSEQARRERLFNNEVEGVGGIQNLLRALNNKKAPALNNKKAPEPVRKSWIDTKRDMFGKYGINI